MKVVMKISSALRLSGIVLWVVFMALPITQAYGSSNQPMDEGGESSTAIQDGEWSDHFWTWQLQEAENIDVQASHLILKYREQLHWTQTWTAHFASGEFWQTEAISDSVRLAWDDSGQTFFTTGTFVSAVFDAGKAVDWSAASWRYSRIPDGLLLEFRTGNTPVPDDTWTGWKPPAKIIMEYYCAYAYDSDETQCFTNLSGIDSSRYLQYRASFDSDDSARTIELFDIDFIYGIHCLAGTATSILISPLDLLEWDSVAITSTIPENTTLSIDLLAPDGTVLLADVKDGDRLAGIDPREHPAVQLHARLSTADEAVTPDIDLWGIRWSVWNRLYIPVLYR
jgi:hypothetical protein